MTSMPIRRPARTEFARYAIKEEEGSAMSALKWLNKYFEEAFSSLLLVAMTLLIFAQIIFRATGVPLAWTEELARYAFVWLIYMSSSYAVRKRAHIKVELLNVIVKGKLGHLILNIWANAAFFVFAAVIAYFTFGTVYRLKNVNPQFSPATQFPMWIAYLSVSVGFALMIYRLIADTVTIIADYRKSEAGGEAT
jgi:TRAP-type C4-dicarboxylate transport system permease small subunit